MLLDWLNRISRKAILIRDLLWRLSQYLYLYIIFHKTFESGNTLAERYSIFNPMAFLKYIHFQCQPAKLNYLLKYILENKLTKVVLCWAVLAYFYPIGAQILNLFPCFPWPRILRSLCPRVTSCKMVTISFTLFIKSVQAHCLKAMRVFIKKAIPLPIYLVILKSGFELLPSDIWECCASFIACVFLKWTSTLHPLASFSCLVFYLCYCCVPIPKHFSFSLCLTTGALLWHCNFKPGHVPLLRASCRNNFHR